MSDRAESDPQLIANLVTLFLNHSTERLPTPGSAYASRDVRVIHGQAHSLKKSALHMGTGCLARLCTAPESAGAPHSGQRQSTRKNICDQFAVVREAMQRYVRGTEATVTQ